MNFEKTLVGIIVLHLVSSFFSIALACYLYLGFNYVLIRIIFLSSFSCFNHGLPLLDINQCTSNYNFRSIFLPFKAEFFNYNWRVVVKMARIFCFWKFLAGNCMLNTMVSLISPQKTGLYQWENSLKNVLWWKWALSKTRAVFTAHFLSSSPLL